MSRQSEIKSYTYTGKLSCVFDRFVSEKRGMGILFNSEAKKLAQLDRFTLTFDCHANTLSKDLVIAYTAKTSNESDSNHRYRVNLINRLALFMQRNGYEAYIQPTNIRKRTSAAYLPYIFSDSEIEQIFLAADTLQSNAHHRNYHLVVPLLFKVLYSCGLRLSEVRHLTVGDVDLENGILRIQGTKFDKDRLVPLSISILGRCRSYSKCVHPNSSEDSIYFPNARNDSFSMTRIYDIFREILQKAGISHGGVGKGPRIHDFRHTFAVNCLRSWTESGMDVSVGLPYLSAYLGHTGLESTQKYLHLTVNLFPAITSMLVKRYGDMIPYIGGNNNETN